MTISSSVNKSGPYTENGVTKQFEYKFKLDNEKHIKVVRAVGLNEAVLILGTHYTVSGVGNDKGNVVIIAPVSGSTLTLIRNVPFTQELTLENQGPYFAEDVMRALDLGTMRDQQLAEELNRTVKVPVTSDVDPQELVNSLLTGAEAAVAAAIATGKDRVATAADRVATGQDKAATAADRVATGQDKAATAADRVATGQDKAATAADRVVTGQDRTATAADRVATGQDRSAAAGSAGATAADRVVTGQDRAAAAADRVATGQDRSAAAASATSAAASLAAMKTWKGTQAEYNALPVKDPETLYFIK